MSLFKAGDWIKNKYDFTPYYVREVYPGSMKVSKLTKKTNKISSTSIIIYSSYYSQYEFADDPREISEELTSNKNPLYSFTEAGEVKYGIHIGTNSSGSYIIEEKGTGQIFTRSKDEIEEVLPYTFTVEYMERVDSNQPVNFLGDAESVSVGDLLLYVSRSGKAWMCTVKKVDSKVKTAAKFKGFKLQATSLSFS